MGQWNLGLYPVQAILIQRQRAEDGGRKSQRMDGGTDIVPVPWESQLLGASAAADGLVGFVDDDRMASARQSDRGGETVGPRADNHGIIARSSHELISPWRRFPVLG